MGARTRESVHGNTYEELLPLLDYYYDRDRLKAYCIANLLLDMDVADEHRQRIELRRCIAAYYAGLYKVAKSMQMSFYLNIRMWIYIKII